MRASISLCLTIARRLLRNCFAFARRPDASLSNEPIDDRSYVQQLRLHVERSRLYASIMDPGNCCATRPTTRTRLSVNVKTLLNAEQRWFSYRHMVREVGIRRPYVLSTFSCWFRSDFSFFFLFLFKKIGFGIRRHLIIITITDSWSRYEFAQTFAISRLS